MHIDLLAGRGTKPEVGTCSTGEAGTGEAGTAGKGYDIMGNTTGIEVGAMGIN